MGEGLSESLFEAVRETILKENLSDSTKVHLTLTPKEHSNGTVNSRYLSHLKYEIPAKEFVHRGDYVHAMLESLARKMNSAQNMNPAIGFNATLTFITYPDKGGKGPASKNPNRLPFDLMHKAILVSFCLESVESIRDISKCTNKSLKSSLIDKVIVVIISNY